MTHHLPFSIATVLEFYAELGNGNHAERLLRHMQELDRIELLPSFDTYCLVLKALRNSVDDDRFDKSEALLREMYDIHESGSYAKAIKPNSVSLMHKRKSANVHLPQLLTFSFSLSGISSSGNFRHHYAVLCVLESSTSCRKS